MTMRRRDACVLSFASLLIGTACRRLPAEIRDDCTREWISELHAILDDPDTRWWLRRATHAIVFAADQQRTTIALANVKWWRLLLESLTGPTSRVFGVLTVAGLGLVFSVLTVIAPMAGYGSGKYLTSGGDSSNVSNAKNTIIYATTGMIGVLAAGLILLGPTITLAIAGGGLVLNIMSFFMAVSPKTLAAMIKAARAKKLQPDTR
jgi:Na+-transporting methylmalonyl-CoA/oxaloacetate decarboxylase gamma subunit